MTRDEAAYRGQQVSQASAVNKLLHQEELALADGNSHEKYNVGVSKRPGAITELASMSIYAYG
jgi:hypothetical protein